MNVNEYSLMNLFLNDVQFFLAFFFQYLNVIQFSSRLIRGVAVFLVEFNHLDLSNASCSSFCSTLSPFNTAPIRQFLIRIIFIILKFVLYQFQESFCAYRECSFLVKTYYKRETINRNMLVFVCKNTCNRIHRSINYFVQVSYILLLYLF